MRRLILALAIVALVAMPAFASVQNVKVGGGITSTFLVRDSFDLGLNNVAGSDYYQNLLITQTHLTVDADLTDNVSTHIRLLNERAWGETDVDGADSGDVDICLAYVTLKEMLYSPLTVMVGRQDLQYGNGLLIGKGGPNNVVTQSGLNGVAEDLSLVTAYDAVRLVLDYNPLTIDVFASKIDANNIVGAGAAARKDDIDLYGINTNYQLSDAWKTTAEAYFFSRIDNSIQNGAVGAKADSVYAPGLRASTNPISGLNLQGEVAWQFGNKASTVAAGTARADNQRREAMAAQVIASYALPFERTKKWSPVVAGWGTYLSGDSNPTDATYRFGGVTPEKYTAWDPMFEAQSGGTIYNTLFDYSNALILGGSLQVSLIEDLLAKLTFTGLWLDKDVADNDGYRAAADGAVLLRQPDGTTITPGVTSNIHVGNEIDADFTYQYTEDVKLGFSAGWFFPGQVFDAPFDVANGNDESAKQFLASVDVAF